MATNKPKGLHFVVSTNIDKPGPELRKFIRRHGMLGKNVGKTRLSRNRDIKATQEVSSSKSHAPSPVDPSEIYDVPPPQYANLPVTAVPRKFGSDLCAVRFSDPLESGEVDLILQYSSFAKQLLFPLEPCIFFDRRAELWLAPLEVDPLYVHSLVFTTQYLFDVILSNNPSIATNKRLLPRFLKTIKLLRERLNSRDDDDGDAQAAKLSNSTATVVLYLASYALLSGDVRAARYHMEGLGKLIKLRGGFASFGGTGSKLLVEIFRTDIGIALHSGSPPVFFNHSSNSNDPSAKEPSFWLIPDLTPLLELRNSTTSTSPASKNNHPNSTTSPTYLSAIDPELLQIWTTISSFCTLINYADATKQRISTETYLDVMASVVYRLLVLDFGFSSTSSPSFTNTETEAKNEALRLSLLAFSSSIFLQWKRLGLTYAYLTAEIRQHFRVYLTVSSSCSTSTSSTSSRREEEGAAGGEGGGSVQRHSNDEDSIPPKLHLWFLVVASISVLSPFLSFPSSSSSSAAEEDAAWLRSSLRTSLKNNGVESWAQLKELLMDSASSSSDEQEGKGEKLPWIPLVHDAPGRRVWDSLFPPLPSLTQSLPPSQR